MMKELQQQFEEPEEREGSCMFLVALLLGAGAVIQRIFSRKKKIWNRIVSAKEGVSFLQKKAEKYRITMTAWKVAETGDGDRYVAVYSVHRGNRTWYLYGCNDRKDEWELTNDTQVATLLWKRNCGFLSEEERKELIA